VLPNSPTTFPSCCSLLVGRAKVQRKNRASRD
jgi:hypothetical protein